MKYIYSLIKLGLGIPKFWALNPITFLQSTTMYYSKRRSPLQNNQFPTPPKF